MLFVTEDECFAFESRFGQIKIFVELKWCYVRRYDSIYLIVKIKNFEFEKLLKLCRS
jgi:hypothetical protein